jgi:hypothetical protein
MTDAEPDAGAWPLTAQAHCRGHREGGTCRAPILFTRTDHGNTQPVDPVPVDNGILLVWTETDADTGDTVVRSHVEDLYDLAREEASGERAPRYDPHHYRCPDRDLFRQKGQTA